MTSQVKRFVEQLDQPTWYDDVDDLDQLDEQDDERDNEDFTEGRYEGGYRVYSDGSYREDFGSDR